MAREKDRGYWLAPPYHGPYISAIRALSIGIKRCGVCGNWKAPEDFNRNGHWASGQPKHDSYCTLCRRDVSKATYERNVEERKARSRANYRAVRADPVRLAHRREVERNRARIYRAEDPDKEYARTRRYRARVYADPVRHAALRANRQDWYFNRGGKELIAAGRARQRLRKRFAQILANALRAELERREREAREKRAKRQAWLRAWVADRKRRWEAGEFDNLPPVYVNGRHGVELRRLPAKPLAEWIDSRWPSVDAMAKEVQMLPRSLFRYTNGEAVTVAIEVVDEIAVRADVLLLDIYDPSVYPDLYEPPPSNGEIQPAA